MSDTSKPGFLARLRIGSVSVAAWVVIALIAVVALVGSVLIGLSPAITIALLVVALAGALLLNLRRPSEAGRAASTAGFLGQFVAAGVLALVVLNVIPGTRGISNPPTTGEPNWAGDAKSAGGKELRALVVRACYDCHSNETEKPWYANVAPISMALKEHVEEGRDSLNFSEYTVGKFEGADESTEVVREGEMPPAYFTRFGLHSTAKLSDTEKQRLVELLAKTPGLEPR